MTRSKSKLSKGNFKDEVFFFKTGIRAFSIVWCNNFIYLHNVYDVHLWALNLSGKGLFFLMKSP